MAPHCLKFEKDKINMKIVLVFSGQGAQKSGMGLDLYENDPAAKAVFDRAGEEIKRLCFTADEAELMKTENTQPAVYTVTAAATAALMNELSKRSIGISAAAGHSLGEYAALTAAGVFDFSAGLSLVKQRGALMAKAPGGCMAAVMGHTDEIISACKSASEKCGKMVLPVNFNAPAQTVVALAEGAMDVFSGVAAERGLKVIPLKVSGAFHSPQMEFVSAALGDELENMELPAPKIPVYANLTAQPYELKNMRQTLAAQASSAVKWVDTVLNMRRDFPDAVFIEVGVGNTLTGLIRKIDRDIKCFNVTDTVSLKDTINKLTEVKNA